MATVPQQTPEESRPLSSEEFAAKIKEAEDRVLSSQELHMVSEDPQCKRPLRRALRLSVGLSFLREKLDLHTIYLQVVFNSALNAYAVYFNSTPIAQSHDNLVIWKANKSSINTDECATSVAMTVAQILAVMGYEVFVNGAEEPFDPTVQGRRDL